MAPLLKDIGRRQVHRDALGRQREANRGERVAHPFARFGHRLVGQSDDREGRHPGTGLHLDIDVDNVDPLKRDGADTGDHG